MKKIMVIIVAIGIALCLTGCGKENRGARLVLVSNTNVLKI